LEGFLNLISSLFKTIHMKLIQLLITNNDLPVIVLILPVIGCGVFLFFGIKGIIKKETINLSKLRGFSARESHELTGGSKITGNWAVALGIFYVLIGLFLIGVMCFVFLSGS